LLGKNQTEARQEIARLYILESIKLAMALISLVMTSGILAIIVGILVLIWPKLLRIALGFYLIIVGILQLIS